MSPENTHKLMGFYMEGLILGVTTMYMFFCFSKLFLIGCIGLSTNLTTKLGDTISIDTYQLNQYIELYMAEKAPDSF